MNKEEYQELVQTLTPKEPKLRNAIVAFLVGGSIGFIGEIIVKILMESFGLSRVDSCAWLAFILILFASLMTALGKFDNWVTKAKCGLIIPTTGFAHSVQSAALDYKKEGFITGIGANMFKLAGSVILFGIVSSFFLVLLRVMLYG
ncbi:MAG: SpoVA/SpoVAEb family sporulation membrane protein [Bacilli bacterium]|nr:SpoVA/SpoVAEb family sporulation membrane protein [Bacilli bacterium]MBQ8902418.1 SpoVA/SpoVAEb family sporulation membrane protein [Bacilli bacterium]